MNLKKTIVIAVAVGIAGAGFVLWTLLTSVISRIARNEESGYSFDEDDVQETVACGCGRVA